MTLDTVRAYLDHGEPDARIMRDLAQAKEQIASLAALGIDLDDITEQLEEEGVKSVSESFDRTLRTIAEKRAKVALQPRA